jgi:hypothetical protein
MVSVATALASALILVGLATGEAAPTAHAGAAGRRSKSATSKTLTVDAFGVHEPGL